MTRSIWRNPTTSRNCELSVLLQFDGDKWVTKGLAAREPIRLPTCFSINSIIRGNMYFTLEYTLVVSDGVCAGEVRWSRWRAVAALTRSWLAFRRTCVVCASGVASSPSCSDLCSLSLLAVPPSPSPTTNTRSPSRSDTAQAGVRIRAIRGDCNRKVCYGRSG